MASWSKPRPRMLPGLIGALCIAMVVQLAALQWQDMKFERILITGIESSNARHRMAAHYLSLLQDVETGQRGFVVTGNPEFLQPLREALVEIEPSARYLARYYASGSREAWLVHELLSLGEAKLRISAEVVSIRERRGKGPASAEIARGKGKRVMDRARSVAGAIQRFERDRSRSILVSAADQRSRRQDLILLTQMALLAAALALVAMLLATVRRLNKSTQSLQDASMRQAAVFDNATDAMMMLDENGNMVSFNAAAQRLFGRLPQDMIGRSNLILFADPPGKEASQAYLRALARGDASARPSQDFVGRRGDGSTFETEVVTTPVQLHDRLHFLAVGRDTTERRRVERMKTDFVATVSHELRTPLTSISGSLGLLAGGAAGDLGDKARRLIDIALNNSQRLIRLINDMLDIEKIESGKMHFDTRPLPVEVLLHQAIEANSGFAHKHQVELQLLAVPADAAILADADRITQVLTNLISNAIKFSPAGGLVTLTAARSDLCWRISIADNGPGIPDEFRSRIFGKFAQAEGGDARVAGGSGLGLSIVKEIVTRSGGQVLFDSSPGRGTVFHVDLPAVPALAPNDDVPIAPSAFPADGRAHILHVEDDPDTLRVMASAFDGQAEVHSTPSIREAEASLRRFRFDAVLLDISLHDGSGLELIPLIRRSSPHAPVILFTALDVSAEDAAKVDAVVIKSRTPLSELIEQAMRSIGAVERKAA